MFAAALSFLATLGRDRKLKPFTAFRSQLPESQKGNEQALFVKCIAVTLSNYEF